MWDFLGAIIAFLLFIASYKLPSLSSPKASRLLIFFVFVLLTTQAIFNVIDSKQRKDEIVKPIQNIEITIESLISKYEKNLDLTGNLNDPRLKDGGKISVRISSYHGPVLDIGSRRSLDKNRITIEAIDRKYLTLRLLDVDGKEFYLQGSYTNPKETTHEIQCAWSSKYGFISLIDNGAVIAMAQIPEMTIFHDISVKKTIQVAGTLDRRSGNGSIRDLKIYSVKELGRVRI